MRPNPKYFDRLRIRPRGAEKPASPRAEAVNPETPVCQWDGCEAKATHRAPVGRMAEDQYFRFCIDHVREYNKGYNYFSGLSDTDIARYQKEAITGHRPTWRFGAAAGAQAPDPSMQRSGSARAARMREGHARAEAPLRRLKTLEAKAMETLGLPPTARGETIKARYHELVKLHHPDANGGDRGSEERFREVIEAFRLLKQAGLA